MVREVGYWDDIQQEELKDFILAGRMYEFKEPDKYGNTFFHDIAGSGEYDLVRIVAEYDVGYFSSANLQGYTPLHYAARNGYKKIVEILVRCGITINRKNHYGDTPLDYAKALKQQEIIELLEKNGGKND
ncbi:ankyrin repeat domain-containing protein [Candidatus Pacearchaeota archaeon]|nr:ankyrin repeat domain-containing protein [Candidatus Pacearchaeota archaeon]